MFSKKRYAISGWQIVWDDFPGETQIQQHFIMGKKITKKQLAELFRDPFKYMGDDEPEFVFATNVTIQFPDGKEDRIQVARKQYRKLPEVKRFLDEA